MATSRPRRQANQIIDKVSLVTPVPGGLGPLTVACMLQNLMRSFELMYPMDK